jgi:vacuolar-type H+-ATPase subunit I/STV1
MCLVNGIVLMMCCSRIDNILTFHIQEIDSQKGLCEEVIASKNSVIKEFRWEIKIKEDEYQKLLSKQAEEIGMFSLCSYS